MKLFLTLIVFAVIEIAAQSSISGQDMDELRRRVDLFALKYAEALKNVRCDVEGLHAGTEFRGSFAILNGVRPFKFPQNGAFRFSRTELKSSRQVIKIGNPQYSFRLEKRQPEQQVFELNELNVQFDNQRSGDSIFRTFSSTDTWALFAPIMIFDLTSTELVMGNNGVKGRIVQSDHSNQTAAEFDFPSDERSGHVWAKVSFGESGEIVNYVLKDRGGPNELVTYSHVIVYSESGRLDSGVRLPSEFHELGEKVGQEFKLSNFQFGKNEMPEFTLTHYGIPEPVGSTLLDASLPYWLLGTVAGGLFLAIGIYLQKRSERST
jgi:hypothetical protein